MTAQGSAIAQRCLVVRTHRVRGPGNFDRQLDRGKEKRKEDSLVSHWLITG